MNTFHIKPTDTELALQASFDVAYMSDDDAVAVRADEHGLYGVFESPEDRAARSGYLWEYVNPKQWLTEFAASLVTQDHCRELAEQMARNFPALDSRLPWSDRVSAATQSVAAAVLWDARNAHGQMTGCEHRLVVNAVATELTRRVQIRNGVVVTRKSGVTA